MDLNSLITAYLALSAGHTLGHLDMANKTNAPAKIEWSKMAEDWERPRSEFSTPIYGRKQYWSDARTNRSWIEQPIIGYHKKPTLDESARNGAGFSEQDTLNSAMNSPESSLANALYKGLYLSGISDALTGSGQYKHGDIGGIAKNSGISEDKVRGLVGASALADLIRAYRPKDNWNIQFDITGGRPGLLYTKRW